MVIYKAGREKKRYCEAALWEVYCVVFWSFNNRNLKSEYLCSGAFVLTFLFFILSLSNSDFMGIYNKWLEFILNMPLQK